MDYMVTLCAVFATFYKSVIILNFEVNFKKVVPILKQ